jgi:hypothetical protein
MGQTTAPPPAPADSVFFEFPARAYLEKYYSAVGAENAAILRAIGDYVERSSAPTDTVIEVAGGPSLYSLMAIASRRGRPFRHVTFTDIGWKNLREVESWVRSEPNHFDYGDLLGWLEDEVGTSPATINDSLRDSNWELCHFDWRDTPPRQWRGAYDVVSAHFFAESATSDEQELVEFIAKIADLGRPGATVLLSFMCRSDGYTVGLSDFPAFSIDETNVFEYLSRGGLELEEVSFRTAPTEDPASGPGYDGMIFIGGRLADAR